MPDRPLICHPVFCKQTLDMKVKHMLSFPHSTYEKTAFVKAALKKHAAMSDQAIDITGRYLGFNEDYVAATELLRIDRHGQVTNKDVYAAIREALISNTCELQIKRQIFLNLLSDKSNLSRTIFDILLKEISASGYQVNLDCVDLSYLKLLRLNFSNMSLRYADFSHSVIVGTKFTCADLTKVNFSSARLRLVNMEDAMLHHANWNGASLNRMNMYGADDVDLTQARDVNRIWIDPALLTEQISRDRYLMIQDETADMQEISTLGQTDVVPCCCVFL